jgi:hypothetical protein
MGLGWNNNRWHGPLLRDSTQIATLASDPRHLVWFENNFQIVFRLIKLAIIWWRLALSKCLHARRTAREIHAHRNHYDSGATEGKIAVPRIFATFPRDCRLSQNRVGLEGPQVAKPEEVCQGPQKLQFR